MVRKFFPLDKNYLLESAQLLAQDTLLSSLIEKVKRRYEEMYNPLGIPDELTLKVRNYKPGNLMPLLPFYQNLAGVYRYKFGANQLEFLWTGEDHAEKYHQDWATAFDKWTSSYCQSELFIRAVMDLTVFLSENRNAQLAENRMNHFILQQFEIRFHKQRGIVAMKVA